MSLALRNLALALMGCSCANAGNPGSGDGMPKTDAAVKRDSNTSHPDTPPPIDASIDATQIMIDAPIDGATGPLCHGNNECTVAGECCLAINGTGLCVRGKPIGDACLPN